MAKVMKIIDLASLRLCNVAMVAMFFLMCFTTVDVILRKFVTAIGGITDSADLTNFILVVVIFCGFAYLETQHGHIRVDVFVNLMPGTLKKVVEGVMLIIASLVLFLTAYAFFSELSATFMAHKVSQVMHVPQWPFELVCGISVLLYAIVELFHGLMRLAEKSGDKDPECEEKGAEAAKA